MEVIQSFVKFEDFVIMKAELKFIYPPDDQQIDVKALMGTYPVDIDFGTRSEDGKIFAFVKTSINFGETPAYGYQLFCEGMGVTEPIGNISEQDLTVIRESALILTVNQIRGFLFNITGYGAFGKYVLPAVDVDDLIRQKNEAAKAAAKGKVSKKKKLEKK